MDQLIDECNLISLPWVRTDAGSDEENMGGSTPPSLKALKTLYIIAPTGAFRGLCFPPVARMIGEAPPIAFCTALLCCASIAML